MSTQALDLCCWDKKNYLVRKLRVSSPLPVGRLELEDGSWCAVSLTNLDSDDSSSDSMSWENISESWKAESNESYSLSEPDIISVDSESWESHPSTCASSWWPIEPLEYLDSDASLGSDNTLDRRARKFWNGASLHKTSLYWRREVKANSVQIDRPYKEAVTQADLVSSRTLLGTGKRQALSIGKAKSWNLEEILKRYAVRIVQEPEIETGKSKFHRATTYSLPVVGYLREKKDFRFETELSNRFKWGKRNQPCNFKKDPNKLYQLVSSQSIGTIKVKLLGEYPKERPKELFAKDPLMVELAGSLTAPRGSTTGKRIRKALCGPSPSNGYFCPSKRGQFLEVDLGKQQLVKAVSTAARTCRRHEFPTAQWIQRQITLGNFNLSKNGGKYNGPTYMVCNVSDPTAFSDRFFPAYELWYKVDKGSSSAWTFFGVMKGPHNNFEERVQRVDIEGEANSFPNGIKCRYLRFIPLPCPNVKHRGMRVMVFGHRQPLNSEKSTCRKKTLHKADQELESESEFAIPTVQYTVNSYIEPHEPVSLLCPKGSLSGRCKCSWCYGPALKPEARRLRQTLKQHATRRRLQIDDNSGALITNSSYSRKQGLALV